MDDRKFVYNVDPIERARLAKGLAQFQLAELAGISRPTLRSFLAGDRQSPKTATKLAKALDLKLADLVVRVPANEEVGA